LAISATKLMAMEGIDEQLEVISSTGSSTAMWKEKESTTFKFLVKQMDQVEEDVKVTEKDILGNISTGRRSKAS